MNEPSSIRGESGDVNGSTIGIGVAQDSYLRIMP